ncbi:MAG: NfeD family protein [Lautropia sp.]
MSVQAIWWLLAIALGAIELFTGSFYLLVLALGAAAAAVAAMAGGSLALQLLAAAVVSAGGAAVVRRLRPPSDRSAAARSQDLNLDIGEHLVVEHWDAQRRARVSHRGTGWDVELLPGEPADARRYVVREVSGNRLRLAAAGPD